MNLWTSPNNIKHALNCQSKSIRNVFSLVILVYQTIKMHVLTVTRFTHVVYTYNIRNYYLNASEDPLAKSHISSLSRRHVLVIKKEILIYWDIFSTSGVLFQYSHVYYFVVSSFDSPRFAFRCIIRHIVRQRLSFWYIV